MVGEPARAIEVGFLLLADAASAMADGSGGNRHNRPHQRIIRSRQDTNRPSNRPPPSIHHRRRVIRYDYRAAARCHMMSAQPQISAAAIHPSQSNRFDAIRARASA